ILPPASELFFLSCRDLSFWKQDHDFNAGFSDKCARDSAAGISGCCDKNSRYLIDGLAQSRNALSEKTSTNIFERTGRSVEELKNRCIASQMFQRQWKVQCGYTNRIQFVF